VSDAAMAWEPPPDLDPECLELCRAINALPGLTTIESCCGHGRPDHGFWIWLTADTISDLMPLSYQLDSCHSGYRGWELLVDTDCGHDPDDVKFWLRGPVGAYAEADAIARNIMTDEVLDATS
jgi:hypothetical protein